MTLTATPASVAYGGTTRLSWASTEATVCSVPWGSSATSGSYTTPALFGNTPYTITCYGPAGSNSGSITVAVSGPPPAPTVTVSADPPLVPFNATSTLSWASTNATSCNTPWGASATSGSYVTPPITYGQTFTITCSGYGGSNAAAVFVNFGAVAAAAPAAPAAPPTVTVTASPASIAYGASSGISWSSTNATTCTTPWGSTAISGSQATPALTASTSYTVSCTGSGGTRSASANVTVAAAPPPVPAPTVTLSASPSSIANGASTALSWSSTNATSCTTAWGATATAGNYTTPALTSSATYSVSCTGAGGTRSASTTVSVAAAPPPVTPAPSVTLAASPASVAYNASTVLNWASINATICTTPWGSTATSGSITTPALTRSTTYVVSCTGTGGTGSSSTTVTVAAAPPATPAPTVTLAASPASIAYNASTVLNWASTNATGCTTPWGATATSGSYTTPALTASTAYTVTCTGTGGAQTATASVTVAAAPPAPPAPAPPPSSGLTLSLTASPASVYYGGTSTLTWASTNASYCSIPWGSSATSGTYTTPNLFAASGYTITCYGPSGSKSASVTVAVDGPPPKPTVTVSASPAAVPYNGTATLSWASTNATSCNTPWGASATSGTYTTPPVTYDRTYTVTCSGYGGSNASYVNVRVGTAALPAPTVTLSASPASIAYGGTSTLSWNSTNATACTTPWGSTATSGSQAATLTTSTTFTVSCTGSGGSQAASATVAVAAPPVAPAPTVSLAASPAALAFGGTTTLSWNSTNATTCTTPWGSTATSGTYVATPASTITFTVSCTGSGGTQAASSTVTVAAAPPVTPAPTVSLAANPASVGYGASTTLSWTSTNATACTTPWAATAVSGSQATPALTATTSYTVNCVGAGGAQAATVTVAVASQGGESNPPLVFNASTSARPGDVISLQGDNFGSTPFVSLDSEPGTALEIVNRIGTTWLAVQIPGTAQGALVLRIRNATGTSAPVLLNAARPMHLDAIQLVPGGAFRIFGRNLLLAGSTPSVRMDGIAATVDLGKSNEHMLSVTAPATLGPTASTVLLVDNGNGSGAVQLDRAIAVVAGSGDPFGLGVGWAAGFAGLATRSIDAATDSRLSPKVVCDGIRDDTPAIQQAITLASSIGGAVVKLPAGRCRLAGRMNMQSNVVVQGAGKTATELVYETNYPVFGVGLDLVGIRNLTLTNAGPVGEGPLLKQGTRVVWQNVRVQLGTSRQMYIDGNRNIVVSGCDFVQTGSLSFQGPYILNDSAGLVFQGNTTQWVGGAPSFGGIHDSVVQGNRFTRDASGQNQPGNGTVHSLVIDFAYRIAVVGNTFDVANGPVTNKLRNDGETILTEGGGNSRTESLGTVGSAGASTLTDTSNTLNADPFGNGYTPENYGLAIVAGKGAGQTRRMVSYRGATATVDRPWDVAPDGSSKYASFVWGLEKSLIKDNTLSQNPRGIWLYQTALRDVDVIGNSISEGGGIYLRAYQNLSAKMFTPIYNVRVAQNRITNTTGNWMSYLTAMFVNADARAFGIAMLGIEVRGNQITTNVPNLSSQLEEYAGVEGYMNMMRMESSNAYESSVVPRVLGTIFDRNSCTNCEVAVRIGTGAGGTTILNTQLYNTLVLYSDWATTGTGERATATVLR